MPSIPFAVYLHPEVAATSRRRETIGFVGQSLPYLDQVRAALAGAVADYPVLPLARADLALYQAVHDRAYLDVILRAAHSDSDAPLLPVNAECAGLEHCLPGYEHSLGGLATALDQMRGGSLERVYCFSLGGHHAFPDRGHGYCLLNPLAALATTTAAPMLNSFFGDRSTAAPQTEEVRQAVLAHRDRDGVVMMVTHMVNIVEVSGLSPQQGEALVARGTAQGSVEVLGRLLVDAETSP